MRLRKGENNTYIEQDYFQIQLNHILDKQSINKKIMYKVEWKDGRQEWVLQKKIEHELEMLNEFESIWWKNKRKMEKEGVANDERSLDNIKQEEINKKKVYMISKGLAKLKGKKINLYDNLDKDILLKNTIKMNESDTISPNMTVDDKAEDSTEKQDINTFEIKKMSKVNLSPLIVKSTKSVKSNQSPSEKKIKIKTKNPDIEKVLLNNKRERYVDDHHEALCNKVSNEEEIPRINYPQISILDYEDIVETDYLVMWKKREDGTIPPVSFISEKEAQEKYGNLLIDFLSKTLKDKEIKKLEFPLNN